MIPAIADNGLLPLGRHLATIEEIESRYAPMGSLKRRSIWSEWKELTEFIRATVGTLPAVWLGGSFFSDKKEPGDIDSIYILKQEHILALNDIAKATLYALGEKPSGIGADLVDYYFLYQEEMQDASLSSKHGSANYYLMLRGYWDQLWSRSKHSRQPGYPSNGYLEVIIDGYQQ